jgi:CheY-like chemotaxis protein
MTSPPENLGAGRRVLVLDDNPLILAMAATQIEEAGFEVRTAATLAEFRATTGSWHPEIVLTDIRMPELSGHELCRALKSNHPTAAIPVVLFSGLPEDELARLARECGADGYLHKRDGLEGLAATLNELCESILW